MELSILYVNWNSSEFLRKSVQSVYRYTHEPHFEIIVVDNASSHDNLAPFERAFPAVRVIRSPANIGFAAANNLAFRASSGNCVLLLNPDTELREPSIDILLAHLRRLPDAGILGCKLLNSDGSVQISSIQRTPTLLNQVLDVEYLQLRWPHCPLWRIGPLFAPDISVMPVDAIPGACMLLRRHVYERVGGLTEDYFMYAEDLDLNYKLRRAGFRSYYTGDTAIVHHGGRSSARQTVSHWSRLMQCRAMKAYFRKTHGVAYEYSFQAAVGLVALLRVLVAGSILCIVRDPATQQNLSAARSKWWAVFRWAIGQQVLKTGDCSSS